VKNGFQTFFLKAIALFNRLKTLRVDFRFGQQIYRTLIHQQRHRHIRRIVSPTERHRWFRRITGQIAMGGRIWTFSFLMIFSFAITLILAVPSLLIRPLTLVTLLELLLSFISIFGLFSTIFILVALFNERQRYIVMPFVFEQNSGLQNLSELLRYNFIIEVKRMSELLSLRRVENTGLDANLSFLATSGQHDDFSQDLTALSNISSQSEAKSFLINLTPAILRLLARARVSGYMEKRPSGGIHIRIDFAKRGRDTLSVDIYEPSFSETDPIDDSTIQKLARQLALKLLHQMGQGAHLASNLQSLSHFLTGLQASSERNWWRAADAYQSNIEIEETYRGDFGLGHYHMGVTLIAQGSIVDGIRHLQRAQTSGPPLAETYYMLALMSLSDNYNYLHKRQIEFDTIQKWCDVALSIRHDFPEVFHLLGTTYYRRGKLIQREKTKYSEGTAVANGLDEASDYRMAEYYFRRAKDAYYTEITRLRRSYRLNTIAQADLERLIREWLMVTHRIGDVLRSRKKYALAESYYRDVLVALPNNIRTLIDLSKTYSLQEDWRKAYEFLHRRVRRVPEAQWNTDVNFYVGWMFIGGVSQKNKHLLQEQFNLLGRGVSHLDYALYMRPQYMDSWGQNNWRGHFLEAVKKLDKKVNGHRFPDAVRPNQVIYDFATTMLDNGESQNNPSGLSVSDIQFIYLYQLKWWLQWRQYSLYEDVKESSNRYQKIKDDYKDIIAILKHCSMCGFSTMFEQTRDIRREFGVLLGMFQTTGRFRGMHHAVLRIKVASKIEILWAEANKKLYELVDDQEKSKHPITLLERIAVDITCQIALLGAKSMIEARLFEEALHHLDSTLQILEEWLDRWNKHYQKEGHYFLFSPRVIRFQLATLYSWRAYCLVVSKDDEEIFRHISPDEYQSLFETIERNAPYCIQKALRYMAFHPLALFTRAWLFKSNGQNERAIEELSQLEAILQPFDHNNQIANWRIQNKTPEYDIRSHDPDYEYEIYMEQPNKESSLRFQLARQELVSGQDQLIFLVSPTKVHLQIAENYATQGRYDLSISHIMRAVVLSEYNDIDADALLDIIQQMDFTNRFHDAQAVIKSLRIQRFLLNDMTLSAVKQYIPQVLECVLHTRLDEFSVALNKGKVLYEWLFRLKQKWEQKGVVGREALAKFYIGQLHSDKLKKIFVPEWAYKPITCWDKTYLNDVKEVIEVICKIIVPDVTDINDTREQVTALTICRDAWSDGDKFTELLQQIEDEYPLKEDKDKQRDHKNMRILRLTMLYFFCWDATRLIETITLLYNNMAYNAIELQILEGGIIEDKKDANTLIEDAIIELKKHYDLLVTEQSYHHIQRVGRQLAFTYDTEAWAKMRQFINTQETTQNIPAHSDVPNDKQPASGAMLDENLINLIEARNILIQAIALHQDAAIFYYHLARVELALLEYYILQTHKDERRLHAISGLLVQSYQNWEKAQSLDKYKRLSKSLAWLGRRLEDYRVSWQKRLNSLLGG